MKIIAANWKLQKNPAEARQFFTALKTKVSRADSDGKKMLVFPSSPCFEAVALATQGSDAQWGAQNCYSEAKGAFTGEISAQVVKDMGGTWVLLGHSERRTLFMESSEFVAQKLALVQSLDLQPLLCIGETLAEREAGSTKAVLTQQLKISLSKAMAGKALTVAYEPVWAIGTGKVASPEQVRETHQWVREILSEMKFPQDTAILYGGSVKPENSAELSKITNVDGFLIGGASLDAESFAQIYLLS